MVTNSPGVASIGSHIGLASLNLEAIDEAGIGRRRSAHTLSLGFFVREAGHLGARDCSIFTAAARIASVSREEHFARAVCVAIVTVTGAARLGTGHHGTGIRCIPTGASAAKYRQ